MTNKKFTVKTQEELVANFTSTSDKSIFQINTSNNITSNSLIFEVQENSAKIKFYDETNDIAEIMSFNNDSITISSNVVIQNTLNVSNLNVYGTTTTINTSKYETENLEIINTQLDAPSLRIQQSYESTNLNNILDVGSLNSTGNYEQKMVLDTTGNLNISGNIDFNGNLTNSGNTLIYNENSLKTFLSGKKVTTLNLSQNAEIKINDEVKLFHWSHNINNSDVTNSIYYTDTNLLSDISGIEYGTSQSYKSHVNITADIGEGKYTDNLGFLIQNRQRNNAIGFGYNTISQVGNNTNGCLNIKSKGNLPVSIGNETTNTLYVFNDKVSVGISSPTRLFQVGENANTGANDQVIALSQHAGSYLWELSMTRWNKYSSGSGKYDLEIKPNSTNGTTASNLGSILLMPNINVGIGTTTPSEKLHVSGNTYIEGKVCIGHNIYPNLQPGALSIGYTDADYGGGNNWNTNTAGLLLNCKDNTEIAVHDAGSRIASFMYYEGANNRITIGRNMYWGSISTIALNGDIGIGTSSPDEKLTIYDGRIKIHQNSSTDNAVLHLLSNTYNTYLFTDKTNGTFLIRNHYNNDFIFDSNGNVGIGVSPQTKLHVQGGNNTYLRVETDTNDAAQTSGIEFGIPAFNSAVRSKITSTTHSSDASDLKFYTNPSGSTIAQARMIIDKDGNVGIGTSTPNYKLDVNGDINFTGNLTKGGNPLTSYSDTDVRALLNSGNVGIGTSTPNYKLDVNGDINFTGNLTKGGNPFTLYSDTDVRALLNSGNVGIGTSTPNYKLDVNGDINFTGNLTKTIISTDPVIVPNVSINDNVSFKTVIFENTGDEQTIYTVHFPKDTICDILVIGGGGGGGGGEVQGTGGGGGAGGLIYKTNQTLSGTYNILVGKGGLGMEYSSTTMVNNNNGRDSGIYDSSNNVLYLTKGGGAGGARTTNGASGGSGGGGGGGNSVEPGTGGLPINSDPYIHSIGNSGGGGNKYAKGGGGGGAGGQGSLATGDKHASGAAGNGGLPKIVDITGENRAYAGGGGGGAWQVVPGEGGSVVIDGQIVKVGGDGGYNVDEVTVPGNGVPHTGSGGGGAKYYAHLGTPQNAGNGGSGIVIIRYSTETIENVSYSDDKVENILANLDTHIVPSVDETIDIGSVDKKIRDIYVNKLDVNGDINFTGNLTKGGNPFTSYSDTYVRALLNSGNVGIGIASNCPNNAMVIDSDGMVDLNTNNNSVTILDFTSYNRAGGGQGGSGTHALSMKTNKGINIQYGYSLIVSSSRKIKKEETDLEDGECLQICMGLKPKKYKMIDDRLHGNDYRYGFIAEELEEVLPHAVQSHEQLIPNIYDDATIINNDTIEITKDLEIGVEYTIYNSNEYDKVETEYKMNILEILGNNLYRVDLDMSTMYGGSIFIYGKIDNDVKQLKKDNLFPILTSSVQELHSMIQNQQTQINQLLEILSRNGIS